MKIAFIGTRGIPARYGGFETCAEEIAKRLAKKGHEVWVYGRSGYYPHQDTMYEAIHLVYLREIRAKFFETFLHTGLSLLHALARRFDVLMVFNVANSPWLLIPLALGKKTVVHVDGLEWMRPKWHGLGRRYYQWAERLAVRLPLPLISDSQEIRKYFRERYGRETRYISYGAVLQASRDPSRLGPLGLTPEGYFLQIARFEPENNQLLSIRAFEGLETKKKLVLVGGATYASKYAREISPTRDPRIVLLGFCYDRDLLRELLCHCFAYIHGNEVGGTNPGLLQAMASGCFVIARDVPFNREVGGDAAVYFNKSTDDLRGKMAWALGQPDLAPMKDKARKIIESRYSWDAMADAYERLFVSVASGSQR